MNSSMTTAEIAREIFYEFEINQSCTIGGFVTNPGNEEVKIRGEVVLECLRQLDVIENFGIEGKKTRRKRVQLKDTIGGFVAQRIFKYKNEKRGDEIIYKIWRIQ